MKIRVCTTPCILTLLPCSAPTASKCKMQGYKNIQIENAHARAPPAFSSRGVTIDSCHRTNLHSLGRVAPDRNVSLPAPLCPCSRRATQQQGQHRSIIHIERAQICYISLSVINTHMVLKKEYYVPSYNTYN